MARRVEQVEDVLSYSKVITEVTEIRARFSISIQSDRAPAFALGLDLPGQLDGAAEQQELFGQGGLAGIGMRDDRKGAPARDFGGKRRAVVARHRRPDGNVHAGLFTG